MLKGELRIDNKWNLDIYYPDDVVAVFHSNKYLILQKDAEADGTLMATPEVLMLAIDGMRKHKPWLLYEDPKMFQEVIYKCIIELEKMGKEIK